MPEELAEAAQAKDCWQWFRISKRDFVIILVLVLLVAVGCCWSCQAMAAGGSKAAKQQVASILAKACDDEFRQSFAGKRAYTARDREPECVTMLGLHNISEFKNIEEHPPFHIFKFLNHHY